jgi:hypothetical protein
MSQLTERYVAAVLRSIPTERRDDVDRELRAAIEDAIDARVERPETVEAVETEVLNELGDPDRMAADYSDRPIWLLGPGYYLDWLRLLKVLLATLVPLAGLAALLVDFVTGDGLVEAFFNGIGLAFVVALHVVFWTTLGFIVLERSGEKSPFKWTVERLPLVPDRQITYSETVWGLVAIILTILGIFAQRNLALVDETGDPVPLIDPAAWDMAIPLLLLLLVVEAGFMIVKYRVGRWTVLLAVTNAIMNLLLGGLVIWLLLTEQLLNPEFFAALPGFPVQPGLILAVVVGSISVWSTVEGFVKASRA